MRPGKSIYLVAVVNHVEAAPSCYRYRVWGYFHDQATAVQRVLSNATDMFECGYYNYGLVLEMPPGLLTIPASEHWFRGTYCRSKDGYGTRVVELKHRPAFAKRVIYGF